MSSSWWWVSIRGVAVAAWKEEPALGSTLNDKPHRDPVMTPRNQIAFLRNIKQPAEQQRAHPPVRQQHVSLSKDRDMV